MRTIIYSTILVLFTLKNTHAQLPEYYQPQTTNFWSDARFGGSLGLGFGRNQTNISLAPSVLKPITEQFHLGAGLKFNYNNYKDFFRSTSFGASILGMYHPVSFLQVSAEIEQLRVTNKIYPDYSYSHTVIKDNFWNTAIFLGLGYTDGNVTVGLRYNLLYKNDNFVYSEAWMPFVRVYF